MDENEAKLEKGKGEVEEEGAITKEGEEGGEMGKVRCWMSAFAVVELFLMPCLCEIIMIWIQGCIGSNSGNEGDVPNRFRRQAS